MKIFMIKKIYHFLLPFIMLCGAEISAQELGYIGGVNNLGFESSGVQPLYGLSIGKTFGKNFAIETDLFYSQRMFRSEVQADYITFSAMPQFGIFKDKLGIYAGPILSLNPTLHHSNIENHTYASAGIGAGGRILLAKKVWADLRVTYDYGFTGAYFMNGKYDKYSGILVLAGLKFDLACR